MGWIVLSYASKMRSQSRAARMNSAMKNKLINILSHDLSSPLSNIKHTLDMLESKFIDRDEFNDISKTLSRDIDLTLTLTSNLIKWINVQRKDFKPEIVKFKLNDAIDECIRLYTPMAKDKRISLDYDKSYDFELESDPEMIKIVLRNLLSNAIKFSHANATILIAAGTIDNQLSMSVADDGIGIAEKEVHKLFAENTLQSQLGTNEEKGTGVGLTLCKTILGKLNGNIYAKSKLGSGTTFYFNIPAPNLKRLSLNQSQDQMIS